MENYLNELNPQQEAAVSYCDGPQLVIAGAGSGKTRVLTYKIVHLLNKGCHPYNLMALTFTNKAARTMRERILQLTSEEVASKLWMGTFHSIFARILRYNADRLGYSSDYTIYDANDSKSLIKQIIKDLELDEKVYKPSTIQSIISNAKNNLMSPSDYDNCKALIENDNRNKRPLTSQIYRTYCARCRVAGAMDFDDILLNMNILLRDNPDIRERYQEHFQHILVDEYQDTNFAQHMIILQLTQQKGNLFVVGDDAQSIYSFRGANIDNILRLKDTYPNLKIFKLEHNYRSTKNIIEAANSLIDKNKNQIKKHSFTNNPEGAKVKVVQSYSDFEESYVAASQIITTKSIYGHSFEDFAILYRTNAQSRILEEALRKRNIPYRIYGGLSFYQRKEIKDAVCYCRLALNPNDDEALRRVINVPSRGIGETTIKKLSHCAIEHNVSMWNVICNPSANNLDVNSGTLKKLNAFKDIINAFILENETGTDAYTITHDIVKHSGLYALTAHDNTPENISKRENLEEFINSAKAFVDMHNEEDNQDVRLTSFMAEISLSTDQDQESDEQSDSPKVTLMTVHAAKGLEFKNVIIVGVEEDLFPSQMSKDSLAQIEEERRLLYVAITRAMDTCTITYAKSRYHNGQSKICTPSRFIKEIDSQFLSASQTSISASNGYNSYSSNRETRSVASPSQQRFKSDSFANKTPLVNASEKKTSAPANFKPIAKSSNVVSKDSSDLIHSLDELTIGTKIHHIRFGEGCIIKIDTSGSDDKIVVEFAENDERTLLLKFAKFKILQ